MLGGLGVVLVQLREMSKSKIGVQMWSLLFQENRNQFVQMLHQRTTLLDKTIEDWVFTQRQNGVLHCCSAVHVVPHHVDANIFHVGVQKSGRPSLPARGFARTMLYRASFDLGGGVVRTTVDLLRRLHPGHRGVVFKKKSFDIMDQTSGDVSVRIVVQWVFEPALFLGGYHG